MAERPVESPVGDDKVPRELNEQDAERQDERYDDFPVERVEKVYR
jgi:hypothetical protein